MVMGENNRFNNSNYFDYDVAVIGCGPAGATFARLISPQYRVIVLEKQLDDIDLPINEPESGKCCGGLLAPDAQKQLALQGLTLPRDVLVDPQIFAVRTMDLSGDKPEKLPERFYQRSYINLSRLKFDRWLRSLCQQERIVGGAYVSSITRLKEFEGFRIDYNKSGQKLSVTAR